MHFCTTAIVLFAAASAFQVVAAKEPETPPLMTYKEFKNSLKFNNYPESTQEQYDTVLRLAKKFDIDTKEELAMFLSQVYWESMGLQHTKEIACAQSQCPTHYRTGREAPGKYYFGRGYIQLTWLDNYSNCSLDMYGDYRLVEKPELVSDTAEGAWGSAFWYWSKYVHDMPEISRGEFGHSTMAINGPLECKGPYKIKAFRRYVLYIKVLEAMGLSKKVSPTQTGCYPMIGENAPGFRLCKATGAYSKQAGMFHWCNDNCNQDLDNPTCPADMCECEKSKKQLLAEIANKNQEDDVDDKETSVPEVKAEPVKPKVRVEIKKIKDAEPKKVTEPEPASKPFKSRRAQF